MPAHSPPPLADQPDDSGRPRTRDLSGPQMVALEALLCGSNVSEAANTACVHRQRVSEWLHHDEIFQAELAKGRATIRAASRARMSGLGSEALGVLAEVMRDAKHKDRMRAADRILSHLSDDDDRQAAPGAAEAATDLASVLKLARERRQSRRARRDADAGTPRAPDVTAGNAGESKPQAPEPPNPVPPQDPTP